MGNLVKVLRQYALLALALQSFASLGGSWDEPFDCEKQGWLNNEQGMPRVLVMGLI